MPLPRDVKPTFFLDRDLGRYAVPNALRAAGADIEIHADHFRDDSPDTEWLAEIGKKSWVLLTRDRHILSRPLEVKAFFEAGIHAFILKQGRQELTGAEMGEAFCAALPHMTRLAAQHPPPFLARITPTGVVTELEGYRALAQRLPPHPPTP